MRGEPSPLVPAALGLALALALPACRPLPNAGATRAALTTAGYQVGSVDSHMAPGGAEVDVDVTSATAEEEQAGTVAGIAWTTVPFRFERLNVTVEQPNGRQQATFTRAQLAHRFGPRLPGLDRRDYAREVATRTTELLAGVALPGVALMAGLGWFVLWSGRRRPPAARPRPR